VCLCCLRCCGGRASRQWCDGACWWRCRCQCFSPGPRTGCVFHCGGLVMGSGEGGGELCAKWRDRCGDQFCGTGVGPVWRLLAHWVGVSFAWGRAGGAIDLREDSVEPMWRVMWRVWRGDEVADLARGIWRGCWRPGRRVSRELWRKLFGEVLFGVEPVWRDVWGRECRAVLAISWAKLARG
jgi:hypothetical protein